MVEWSNVGEVVVLSSGWKGVVWGSGEVVGSGIEWEVVIGSGKEVGPLGAGR